MLWFGNLIQQHRERRQAVLRQEGELQLFLGDMAYDEARNRARRCRERQDREGNRFWSRVAVQIAKETGREIRVKVADRYSDAPTLQPLVRTSLECQIIDAAVEISRGPATVARGEEGSAGLHNLQAAIRNAAALVPPSAQVTSERDTLLKATFDLFERQDEAVQWIGQSLYPPALEVAGEALDRFRSVLLKAARG